jgi:D-sedoheptulose 7-phosphate isomerase
MSSRPGGSSGADDLASIGDRLRDRARAVGQLQRITADLLDAATQIAGCFRRGGKLLVFGNGGSNAQAQHLAAELVGRFSREREALPAVALATDSVMVTSLANDFGFAAVFARQIEALGQPGDVAIVISTSGASPNALGGVAAARAGGLPTVGLIGTPDSELHRLVDTPVITPGPTPARVQELQLVAGHLICEIVEDALFPEDAEDEWPVEQGILSIGHPMRARSRHRSRRAIHGGDR